MNIFILWMIPDTASTPAAETEKTIRIPMTWLSAGILGAAAVIWLAAGARTGKRKVKTVKKK